MYGNYSWVKPQTKRGSSYCQQLCHSRSSMRFSMHATDWWQGLCWWDICIFRFGVQRKICGMTLRRKDVTSGIKEWSFPQLSCLSLVMSRLKWKSLQSLSFGLLDGWKWSEYGWSGQYIDYFRPWSSLRSGRSEFSGTIQWPAGHGCAVLADFWGLINIVMYFVNMPVHKACSFMLNDMSGQIEIRLSEAIYSTRHAVVDQFNIKVIARSALVKVNLLYQDSDESFDPK